MKLVEFPSLGIVICCQVYCSKIVHTDYPIKIQHFHMLGTKYMYCDLNLFIYIFILSVICCTYNLLVIYKKIVLFFYIDVLVGNKCIYFVHSTTHLKYCSNWCQTPVNQSIKNVICIIWFNNLISTFFYVWRARVAQ